MRTDFTKANAGVVSVTSQPEAQGVFTLGICGRFWLPVGENPFNVGLTYSDATDTMQAVDRG